ncbi:hypothetical protein [Geodermatophilus sp. SYSU D00700]
MAVTVVRNITNITGHRILFINSETSRDNRYIDDNSTVSVDAWTPWCTKERDFPAHHFEIINDENEQILWYVWQRNVGGDDRVRASRGGWEDPGGRIEGRSQVGGSCNLFVRPDGLSASEA